MKKITRFLMVMILLSAVLLTFSCSKEAETTEKAGGDKTGGVLVFGRSGDSTGLDPARETDGESYMICDNVYETLVQFKAGTTEIEPGLAESWEISADGLEYVFNLRKGVKFHDGTDFTASDVVFSLERQLKEDHPYYKMGPWKYWSAMDMNNIVQDVIAVDDNTVKFILQRPEAPFIANLAMNFAAIVSPEAVEKYGEAFPQNPVGTGPFKFVQWLKDDSITIDRFEEYWGEKAYLDRVIFRAIPDATARYLALKAGEVDLIDYPSPDDIAEMKENKDLKLITQEGLNVGYLSFNNDKKPFDNKLVRQALNYAINRDDVIKGVYGEFGAPAKNPIPPTMWSYNDDIEAYPYDPAKAKKLLAEAGYPDGFKTTFWYMPVSRPYMVNAAKAAEIMQAQFKEIGVETELVTYEWGTYLDKTDNGEHDMCFLGWTGDNGDPDNFMHMLLSIAAAEKPAMNNAFWKNEEYNALVEEAKKATDFNKRVELYKKGQEIFHEEAPWAPIAHSIVVAPMKNEVMDFVLYPTSKRVFHKVWLKK